MFLIFCLYSGLCWSWLLFVRVGRITDDVIVGYGGVIFCYLLVVVISAAVFTQFYKYLKRLHKTDNAVIWLLKAIVVWAIAEALVAWLVALVWMGQNGSLDTSLAFSTLTPFLAQTPLVYLSRFVGFYGLSAVFAVGLVGIYIKQTRRFIPFYWIIVVFLTVLAWKLYQHPTLPPIQATIVAETLDKKVEVKPMGSKLILLPEYGLDEQTSNVHYTRFDPADYSDYYYVGSRQTAVPTGHTNVLIYGSQDQGIVKLQPKTRLIPNGEYLPYGIEMGTSLLARNVYTDFQIRRAVVKGNKQIQPYRINDQLVVGAEVCSSIIAPQDYRQLVRQGATVLTNSASLEIFEGSRLYSWQDDGFARFIAVANARPFLQSTNHWPASALDQNGHLLAQVYPHSQKQVQISPNVTKTIYVYLGEWLAAIGAGLLIFEAINNLLQKRR